ncbi:MAG: hypothetical protein WCG27_07155 [Pseudomonadota bacterium]
MGLVVKFIASNRRLSSRLKEVLAPENQRPEKEILLQVVNDFITYAKNHKIVDVLELGPSDRPMGQRQKGIVFDGLDLEKITDPHRFYDNYYPQSVERSFPKTYDIVFSFALLEHVPHNQLTMENIFNGLKNGGATYHYVPNRFHPYALGIQLLGNKLQKLLVAILFPGDQHRLGYPAYFNFCHVRGMKESFSRYPYQEIKITPFYNGSGYFDFFFPLYALVLIFELLCKKFQLAFFCSGMILFARK